MSIAYKSFCWVLGTTSFRTNQLNRKIELQLGYLDGFWADRRFTAQPWSENDSVQGAYYELLKENAFVDGDAARPEKDAREKTSGLIELGLLDSERRLTEAGRKVLAISRAGDFGIDTSNILDLPKDSYQYFLRLLKATKPFERGYVRPLVAFLHILNKVVPDGDDRKYLSASEFTYLLPMCVDAITAETIIERINAARRLNRSVDVDAVIIALLMRMENYREALTAFRSARSVDENLICLVGMNRKSGANGVARYDAPYLGVFRALHDIVFKGVSAARLRGFVKALDSCKLKSSWLKYFFDTGVGRRLPRDLSSVFRHDNVILRASTEDEFRCAFFKVMHLLKAKATFKDYADLNRRYFCLSDIVVFNDDIVELDLLPKEFVAKIGGWLEAEAFRNCTLLEQDVSLERIVTATLPQKEELVASATGRTMESVNADGGIRAVLKSERYARFSNMLHEKFPVEMIKKLLSLVEDRTKDKEVQSLVTDNADVPTIFEYIVGLAWYYVSGEKGDVLEYMNLSLGSDFLPKTHAGGGEADIVWQYKADPPHYDEHALLIEVTLSEKDAQRRMEMEPVSRHLGDYRLAHPSEMKAYCTFVTTNLNVNVIADFRCKKSQPYYDSSDCSKHVDGLKIMPIDTKMLRRMLEKGVGYESICEIFEDHFNRSGDPVSWHNDLRAEIEA